MDAVSVPGDFLLLLPLLLPAAGGLCVVLIKALDDPRRRRIAVFAALGMNLSAAWSCSG